MKEDTCEKCENCKYWRKPYHLKSDPGSCHRYPHTETKYSYEQCGEFKPKIKVIKPIEIKKLK